MTGQGEKKRRSVKRRSMRHSIECGALLVGIIALGANPVLAASQRPRTPERTQVASQEEVADYTQAMPAQAPAATTSMQEYVLGVSDRIHLTVYGESDLSGDYEVSSTGVVALPLIGDIVAGHKTIREFEQAVRAKLTSGYLRDPRVSVQVTNYRPFFILGEVAKPGSYPFVNGMTVISAVALAGGYTYRADKDDATIVHANDSNKTEQKATEETNVMPGDIIRVPERFF